MKRKAILVEVNTELTNDRVEKVVRAALNRSGFMRIQQIQVNDVGGKDEPADETPDMEFHEETVAEPAAAESEAPQPKPSRKRGK